MKKYITFLFFNLLMIHAFAQMETYGSTTGTCDCYQITDELTDQAGSIWSPNSIDLTNPFDFTFDVNLGDIDAGGADGIVFVIRQAPGDPGGSGGALGYGDIDNSIGIEIDTWENGIYGDIPEDHLGMHSNGDISHGLVAPIALPNVEDGLNHSFRVTWDPVSFDMEVFFDGTSMLTYTGDLTALFFGGDPEVYFGWTGGTGGSFNQQTVCSYRMVDFTTDHTDADDYTTACPGEPIVFTDNSTSDLVYNETDIIEWEWDFGDGSTSTDAAPTHAYASAGTYTVTLRVKDITGCFSESTINIVIGGIAMDFTISEPTCHGFTDGSIVVTVPDGITDPVFTITDSEGNVLNEDSSNAANTLGTGWYYITVDDATDCAGMDSIFIDQPGVLSADISVIDPPCYGFETGTAMIDTVYNATGNYDEISFFWNPNPAGNEGVGEDSTWALGAGDYTVTINDQNGCSHMLDFTVNEPEELVFAELGHFPAYCRLYHYQSGNGEVFVAATGGSPDYTYEWTELLTGNTSTSTTWGGRNPGDYAVRITDSKGCLLTDTVQVDSLNPEASFTTNSVQLNADYQGTANVEVEFTNTSINFANPKNPIADTTFFWSFYNKESWTISHDYNEIFDTTYGAIGQTYQVEVCLVAQNKNGCTDTACQVITIYQPVNFTDVNIFTPNGDGNNDMFTFAFKAASIAQFNCVIVNRWGIVMAELNDISQGWDGTDGNGDLCQDGVYFYTYEAITDNDNTFSGQGTIQLVAGQ